MLPLEVKGYADDCIDYRATAYVPLSDDMQIYTQMVCEEYEISYPLVLAIMEHESGFNAEADNGHGNVGLMQLQTKYFKKYMDEIFVTGDMMKNPSVNMQVGIMFLTDLFEKYEEPVLVLQAYHGEKLSGNSSYANAILKRADYYTDLVYGD